MKAIKEKPLGRLALTALRYALIALVWIGIWLLLAFLAKRDGNELIYIADRIQFLSTPSARRATDTTLPSALRLTIFLSTPSARRATS